MSKRKWEVIQDAAPGHLLVTYDANGLPVVVARFLEQNVELAQTVATFLETITVDLVIFPKGGDFKPKLGLVD